MWRRALSKFAQRAFHQTLLYFRWFDSILSDTDQLDSRWIPCRIGEVVIADKYLVDIILRSVCPQTASRHRRSSIYVCRQSHLHVLIVRTAREDALIICVVSTHEIHPEMNVEIPIVE